MTQLRANQIATEVIARVCATQMDCNDMRECEEVVTYADVDRMRKAFMRLSDELFRRTERGSRNGF